MKLERLGPSMTVVTFMDGTQVLYSYETPCAAFRAPRFGPEGCLLVGEYLKSDRFISRTTSGDKGHVAKWLKENGATARTVPHAEIVKIAEEGGSSK